VSFLSEDVRPFSLAIKRADGVGAIQRVAPLADNLAEGFFSADGQWVIMRTTSTTAGRGDIFARRLGDSVTIPLVATKGIEERHPALSPDGKWLAYRSTEAGPGEVYVRPFPNVNDGKWLVSLDGGGDPVWSHSGRELFYVTRSDELWSATVATSPAFSVRERKKLFALPAGVRPSASSARFAVAPGDQRFLMIQSVDESAGANARTKVVLLTNALAELQAKAGAKK
jgi:serine/threonine-protein kinase